MRRPLIAGLVATAVLLIPGAAWGHVTVSPEEAPKGASDQVVTLRVPNEDDKAATVKVDVQVPTDHPLLGVLVDDKPGWTATVKTTKLAKPITTDDGTVTEAVSEITWTGGKVVPGTYGEFRFIVGQLPDDASQIEFKTIQTYEGGRQVSWIEDPVAEGQPEPESPAPVLKLGSSSSASGATKTPTNTVAATGLTITSAP